jgi:hypothetical protein
MKDVLLTPMEKFIKEELNSDDLVRGPLVILVSLWSAKSTFGSFGPFHWNTGFSSPLSTLDNFYTLIEHALDHRIASRCPCGLRCLFQFLSSFMISN